jgi:arginine decarboxylase
MICECFGGAIKEYGYKGVYKGVFPIKVNQQHHVVEELVRFGKPYNLGLEAGSKPELLVALALQDNPTRCSCSTATRTSSTSRPRCSPSASAATRSSSSTASGNSSSCSPRPSASDPAAHRRARQAQRQGRRQVERVDGDRSKFGLTATELIQLVTRLRTANMLDCLELVHFHIGSQISAIRAIKDSMREAMRFYVELAAQGAGLKFIDVGGGLGVDYDGSQTNWSSSTNYSVQEYANDVVGAVLDACNERGLPHPDIVSESGRALVAHHSVLVFNVLDVNEVLGGSPIPPPVDPSEHPVIKSLAETWRSITHKNFQEAYHDALQLKDEATSLFNLGYLGSSSARASTAVLGLVRGDPQGDPRARLRARRARGSAEGSRRPYFGNFSVFQSAPDHWAVKQLFPVVPLHRLNEKPTRRGVFVDLTCDSDGKMDRFIDLRDVKSSLELHSWNGQPYLMGVFMVGAYQEILGDLHNLFGDTNAIHVRVENDGYRIDHVVEGDSVTEVLGYVQYDRADLVRRVRRASEEALRARAITFEESALLLRRFEEGLSGYTYLEEEPPGSPAVPANSTGIPAVEPSPSRTP